MSSLITLNAQLEFASIPAAHQDAFIGRSAHKVCFLPGMEFYKFSDRAPFGPNGFASPWWFGVKPLVPGDLGLDELIRRASRLKIEAQDFARARAAVTREWNTMNGVIVIRLLHPAFGLVGRCRHQQYSLDPQLSNVAWIGGAWQVYLPNLTCENVSFSLPL
jgi:hypothetical protein